MCFPGPKSHVPGFALRRPRFSLEKAGRWARDSWEVREEEQGVGRGSMVGEEKKEEEKKEG